MSRIKDLFGIEDEIIKGANGILNGKVLRFKNEPVSVKMICIIKKIILENKSNLPNYYNSAKLYYPLINFFLKKWKTYNPKAIKVPIT